MTVRSLSRQILVGDTNRRLRQTPQKIEPDNTTAKLLDMPNEIFLLISTELGILDRAALALSCKDFAAKLDSFNHLAWDGPAEYVAQSPFTAGKDELLSFFRHRLGKGWAPSDVKYCHICGKYGPLADEGYWVERLKTKFTGKRGMLSCFVEKDFLELARSESADEFGCTWFESVFCAWMAWEGECCPECEVYFCYHKSVHGRRIS